MSTDPRRLCGHGGSAPGNGPFMKIELQVVDGFVTDATYETFQCPGCHACGKALCAMVTGKSLDDARAINHGDLVEAAGPLPAHRRICYALTILALANALDSDKL